MSTTNSMPGPAVGTAPAAPHHGPQHAQPPPPQAYYNTNGSSNQNGHASAIDNVQLPERHWSMMTRTIAHYERLEQIGEGTYGQVYKARCKDTDQIVALKKIRVHHGKDWGMPPTVIREIKILKRLQHPNLVRMMEVVSSKGVEHLDEEDESTDIRFQKKSKDRVVDAREGYKGNLFLVLEYVSHDLTGLMDVAYRFTPVQVKCIFRQLLEALCYMHENKYVHRDIKSSNILLDHHFRVKLADFGLARCIEPPILDNLHDRASSQEFTNKVITLWYRPPEILMGATRYGPPVDVWSAGCILAELLLGKPLFTGKAEMDQLQLIFDLMGTPSLDTWEGLRDLKLLRTGQVTIPENEKDRKLPKLRAKYSKKVPSPAMNLLEKLLELDPSKRLTAARALDSRYFLSEPVAPDRPEDLGPIQVMDHFHEFQTKKKRRQAKVEAEKAREAAKAAGMDDEQAQEQYDTCYRKLMKKVASEGIDAFGSSARGDATARREKKERKERKVEPKDEKKRERKEDDRRRREGDSSRRRESDDARREKDRERDESRRKRRREQEEGEDHPNSKERRVAGGEEGEEPDPERRESSRREKLSRERRSRDGEDREREHRRKSRSRRESHESGRERERESSRRSGDRKRERDAPHDRSKEKDPDEKEHGEEKEPVPEAKSEKPVEEINNSDQNHGRSREGDDDNHDQKRERSDERDKDRHRHERKKDRHDRDERYSSRGHRHGSRERSRERGSRERSSRERSRERSPRDRSERDRRDRRDRDKRSRDDERHERRHRDHRGEWMPPSDWHGPPPPMDYPPPRGGPPPMDGPPPGRYDRGPPPPDFRDSGHYYGPGPGGPPGGPYRDRSDRRGSGGRDRDAPRDRSRRDRERERR